MAGINNIDEAKKLIEYYQLTLKGLNKTVHNIEKEIQKVKSSIEKLSSIDIKTLDITKLILNNKIDKNEVSETIEWEFDGVVLIDKDWKKYPVPTNYASKSKLISWDEMKLNIMKNGKMIFKLIKKVERHTIQAILSKDSTSDKDIAIYKNKYIFILNHAAVSYHKWKPGDKVLITVNKSKPWKFAALDTIMQE